ncbi:MAG TPA: DUF2079 domain-containing protein [Gaiellaceae bacterium]|nr:DUF2079 domain-containing protein [Gaiellaceae bacterium]
MEIAQGEARSLEVGLQELREGARRAASSEVVTRRVVYAAAGLYAVVFSAAAAVHFFAFHSARLDLGNMTQAVWATAHGHFLRVTPTIGTPTTAEMSRLAAHVDPFLALFAPLWWIWSSPLMLLVVQAIAVASGALPVYWLARKHLGTQRAAAHFAFAYLLFPATQFNAFTYAAGMHSVSFAIPLILFAIWFLDEDRLVAFAAFALLAASTKEEIPVAVGCLGIWYAVRKGRQLVGLGIFAAGLAATLVNFLVVLPHFSFTGSNPFAGRYAQVGGTPGGMLHKLATDPVAFVHAVATWHKLLFLVMLFVPWLGLWALEPVLLLGVVPDLVVNLLSADPNQTAIQYEYTSGIVPFLVAASILGAARLKRDKNRVSFYALAGAACIALFSPVYFGAAEVREALPSNALHAAKAHALHLIPSGVPVAASNELAGYLSDRRFIYVFPYIRDARWVVLDENDRTMIDAAGYRRTIAEIDASPRWRLVYSSHGVQVLRRRVPAEGAGSA